MSIEMIIGLKKVLKICVNSSMACGQKSVLQQDE